MQLGNQTIINSHVISYEVYTSRSSGCVLNRREYNMMDGRIPLKRTPGKYHLVTTIITAFPTPFTDRIELGEISAAEAEQLKADKQSELDNLFQPQSINL